MKKYRRIEVNAYRRRVTVVSGAWRPSDLFEAQSAKEDSASLNDSDDCEPVEPDSPEGQLILAEAVRTLERRLSPEARALIGANPSSAAPNGSHRKGFFLRLQSFYQLIRPRALRSTR